MPWPALAATAAMATAAAVTAASIPSPPANILRRADRPLNQAVN
jgi:hypothetical protein